MPRRKQDPLAQLVAGIIFVAAMFYIFVVPPLVAWWSVNGWIVLTILGVAGASLLGWFIYSRFIRAESFTPSSESPVSFTDRDGVRHTFFDSHLQNEDPSATILNMVIHEIESFSPFRQYRHENQYQIQLAELLRNKFGDVRIEQQIGSSRPDIVVEKIAIEIKGPTKSGALRTISDKILRYYNNFDSVIIVLFDLQTTEEYYSEWERGISTYYPRVKVIKK